MSQSVGLSSVLRKPECFCSRSLERGFGLHVVSDLCKDVRDVDEVGGGKDLAELGGVRDSAAVPPLRGSRQTGGSLSRSSSGVGSVPVCSQVREPWPSCEGLLVEGEMVAGPMTDAPTASPTGTFSVPWGGLSPSRLTRHFSRPV